MEENKVLSGVIQEIVSLNDNTLVIEKVVNYALTISGADCAVFFPLVGQGKISNLNTPTVLANGI